MSGNYVIGVDGGNSKTDYILFDLQGRFIDHVHAGTCSHERFPDAYASSLRIMDDNVGKMLERNRLSMDDIAAGAFGLAGADIPSQKEELCKVVERIGFRRYAVDNDSFLGVKAGIEKGYGVCCINGSGTVTGGISPTGQRLQIGGVGSELAGDEAGGFYLARKILRSIYDAYYRMGPDTRMTAPVMALLGIPDKKLFLERAWEGVLKRTLPNTELIQILFSAAKEGDAVALGLLDNTAKQLARSTAGCINNLDFGAEVDIVLAGSVWVKGDNPILLGKYRAYVAELTDRSCRFIMLKIPPATGAVLWALELANGHPVDSDTRRRVIAAVGKLQT